MKTEERVKALTEENNHLVNRWLQKMNEEAKKMNEANDWYEQMVAHSKQHDLEVLLISLSTHCIGSKSVLIHS